ncbi:hypothetical protein PY093_17660 [Cytobacillus sp. S13-E01]|uniref:hypothetical protein n=1 Tax=Cytobacillus sp. S13-E01 TaxID=3031326 RepID=UPI0023D7D28D|nr:hypothetical protein [Cytobacillus sp. S13-E01]MDF0728468.1 hypothetical protein [Cytobacillus sp. S13-E01]
MKKLKKWISILVISLLFVQYLPTATLANSSESSVESLVEYEEPQLTEEIKKEANIFCS